MKGQNYQLPKITISWGEYFDRLTILEIKLTKIVDETKRNNIKTSLIALNCEDKKLVESEIEIQKLVAELKVVNNELWEIEESKRECERTKTFDESFVELARFVYKYNDRRAAIKKTIDILLGSKLIEEKSYKPY